MNMNSLDWSLLVGLMALLLLICWGASRLTNSVADFLAANRMAGRYLLAVGQGITGLGAITIAANFEKYYQSGFSAYWWMQLVAPIGLLITLTGFVVYRYRETRAMTMAQFFEIRYSRNFRVFSGILAWSSGILNYGIFPAVSARFLIYFTGLPETFQLFGFTVSTLAVTMIVLLAIAFTMATLGGQISIMITDMIQGQFVTLVMLLVLAVLFWHMSWGDVLEGLRHAPEGQSRINPFKQQNIGDFNVFFFLMMGALSIYGTRAWQGGQGYNAAARSPHEARMAGILGDFRGMIAGLAILMIPIFVFAYLHLDQFSADALQVQTELDKFGNPQLKKQMLVPLALGTVLPNGVMGLFAAVVVMAAISTDNTYLHSWGSIFIQDVILPFRKKPFSPRAHMWALRLSILFVAAFAFTWSMLFPLHEYIYMYFQITGAIYLGGAGAVIIGGLYWKRGTAGGAWAAMTTGSVLAVSGILVRNIIWPFFLPGWKEKWADVQWLVELPDQFPLNGMQMSFITAVIAVLAYVICSLLSRTPPANMEKLLHRGKYAVEPKDVPLRHRPPTAAVPVSAAAVPPAATAVPTAEGAAIPAVAAALKPATWKEFLWKRLGVGPEFTRGDKIVYMLKLGWVMFFVLAFVIGTTIQMFWPIADESWETWWGFKVWVTVVSGLITVVWFLWGGTRDLIDLVRQLRSAKSDASDDGTVTDADRVQIKPGTKHDEDGK